MRTIQHPAILPETAPADGHRPGDAGHARDAGLDYRALAELRFLIRQFVHFSEQAARDVGLEPQHHQLMLAVKGMPLGSPPTINNLAERLQLRQQTVAELVDRTAERDLVVRHRDADDRRQVRVSVTRKGERLLRSLSVHHREELAGAAPALARALDRVTHPASAGDRR